MLRDTADTVDPVRRRNGGMSPVVVFSVDAIATLLIFCFCLGGFIKARAARVPLPARSSLGNAAGVLHVLNRLGCQEGGSPMPKRSRRSIKTT